MLSKRVSRLYAVQILYQLSFISQNKDQAVEIFLKEYYIKDLPEANPEFIHSLINTAIGNSEQVCKIVNSFSAKYTWEQLELIIKCILRIMLAEIVLYPTLDRKILLSEYTLIADSFLENRKVNLVNALLQQLVNYFS